MWAKRNTPNGRQKERKTVGDTSIATMDLERMVWPANAACIIGHDDIRCNVEPMIRRIILSIRNFIYYRRVRSVDRDFVDKLQRSSNLFDLRFVITQAMLGSVGLKIDGSDLSGIYLTDLQKRSKAAAEEQGYSVGI